MASPRKKYSAQVEERTNKDAPVAAAPVQAAEPPPVVDAPKPAEPLEVECPVEEARRNALKQRLQEVERADQLNRQQLEQQRRLTQEAQQPVDPIEQAIATAPERVKRWYRANPQFLVDPEKAAQLNYCHFVAC